MLVLVDIFSIRHSFQVLVSGEYSEFSPNLLCQFGSPGTGGFQRAVISEMRRTMKQMMFYSLVPGVP